MCCNWAKAVLVKHFHLPTKCIKVGLFLSVVIPLFILCIFLIYAYSNMCEKIIERFPPVQQHLRNATNYTSF